MCVCFFFLMSLVCVCIRVLLNTHGMQGKLQNHSRLICIHSFPATGMLKYIPITLFTSLPLSISISIYLPISVYVHLLNDEFNNLL